MKNILFIAGFFLLFSPIYSQNSISGRVYDSDTREALPLATIYIIDLQKGAVTDSLGNYKIDKLPKGNFHIEVRSLGYNSVIAQIQITGDVINDFQLKESHLELKTIMVTGVSVATEKIINPIPSITVNQLKLQETAATNIIDAISNQPGISQVTTGAGISKPVIRGLGFNRVLVLQNSIRQEGQQWGDEHGIEIDENSVDHIEIIKGPGSLAYGSDAMAGVINFLSPLPDFDNQHRLKLNSSYQSNNQTQSYALTYSGNKNYNYWSLQGAYKNAGNYSNKYDGKIYNSGLNQWNVNGILGTSKKWGLVRVLFSSFNQEVGIIEGERDSLGNFLQTIAVNDSTLEEVSVTENDLKGYNIGIPYQKINHQKISTNGKFFLPNGTIQYTLGVQQNVRREYEYHLHDGHIEDEASIYQVLNTGTYDINYHQHFKEWETTFGVNGYLQKGKNAGEEFIIPEYNLNDLGIYAITQRDFDKWYFSGGLRYNIRQVNSESLYFDSLGNVVESESGSASANYIEKFSAFKNNYSALAYSAGLSYRFKEKLIGRINYAGGYRAPNMAELGSNGAHEGTFRYERGNMQLKAETSQQLDISFVAETEHFNLEMAVFGNKINNFIYSRKVLNANGTDSIIVSDGESNKVFSYVQDNALLYGGEISMDLHPHPFDWLHFENSFSLVNAELVGGTDSTQYLPFTPSPRLNSEIRVHFEKVGKVFKEAYFSISMNHTWAQDRIFSAYNTETTTPAYTLLNLSFGADIKNKKRTKLCTFIFTAQNLTDVAYQNHLSRLKYLATNEATGRNGVFNMGRNYTIKLIVPIIFKSK